MSEGAQTFGRLAVLMFTDVVGSSELKKRLGTTTYARLLSRHDELFRQLIAQHASAEVLQDTGDGYFAAFATVSDAVRFALRFQDAMHREPWGAEPLKSRIGIHLGELAHIPAAAGGPPKVVGIAADLAARLMSLAKGGQILLTRGAFDEARQFISEYPATNGDAAPRTLRWMAHGEYVFHGSTEPVQVFEVGGEGIAPLAPPRDREKAHRFLDAKVEILGWRPGVGLTVPQKSAWALEQKLGEGTFGEVWLARHAKLKLQRVFKFCFDAQRLESFKRELTLLRLLHDALGDRRDIARLYDVCLDHPPYFLESEFAPGGNLIDWADAQGGPAKVPLASRLDIVAQVCDAVAAAHSVGVLHKDIKPTNILIHTDASGTPRPQLADFGIGLLTDHAQLAARHITEAGFTMMDPAESSRSGTRIYAPPESLAGRPYTMQGDIYALGILLYQMAIADLGRPLALGWERDIDDELLREDIAACVDGDPQRRIYSAAEVADRLRKLPQRRAEQAAKRRAAESARRRRRLLRVGVVAAAGLVLAVGFGAFTFVQQQRLRASRREAQWAYASTGLQQGIAAHFEGRVPESRQAFVRARDALIRLGISPLAPEVGLYRSFREFTPPINTMTGHTSGLLGVAWFPDGIRVVSAGEDKTIRLWDARTGQEVGHFDGHKQTVGCVAVSPDGRRVLSGSQDPAVGIWEVDSKQVRMIPEPAGEVRGVAFSPDGRFALWATAARPGVLRLLDIDSKESPRTFEPTGDAYYAVAFSPDGQRVLATSYQNAVWIFDVKTMKGRRLHHPGKVLAAAFSPDGKRVLSGSMTLKVSHVDGAESEEPSFSAHAGGVRGVAFVGGTGDLALSCGLDGTLKLWNLGNRQLIRTYAGHDGGVRGVAVSPDGSRAASVGIDKTVRVWNLMPADEVPEVREQVDVTSVSCSPDGMTFVTGDRSGSVKLRDVATLRTLRTFAAHEREVECAVVLYDGRRAFTADSSGACKTWDIASGQPEHVYASRVKPAAHDRIRDLKWCYTAVARDGSFAISSNEDRRKADVWSLATGKVIATLDPTAMDLKSPPMAITCVAISPDGAHALSGDAARWMCYWDLKTARAVFSTPVGKPGVVSSVAFSSDGKFALSAGYDPTVRLWDLNAAAKGKEFTGHVDITRSVAFGRDARTIFSAGSDQTLRIWDVDTASEFPLAARLNFGATMLAVVPPGDVAICAAGPSISLWDVSRSRRHLQFASRLEAARTAMGDSDPSNDPAALATLGEWYGFRGVHDWAVDLLERARAGGANISSLTLARSYWQLDRTAQAEGEYRTALDGSEAPAAYLKLCLLALAHPAPASQATTVPATQPIVATLSPPP